MNKNIKVVSQVSTRVEMTPADATPSFGKEEPLMHDGTGTGFPLPEHML